MKALIVDDDLGTQQLISCSLKKEGFEVNTISDGLDGLKFLKINKPGLVILNTIIPSLDGKIFTKIVRDLPHEYGNPVIIMLSAQTEIEDVLGGLEIGANDYMKKPFDPRELILRAKKNLAGDSRNNKKHIFKDVSIDEDRHIIIENGIEIELSKKEYDLLLFLFKNPEIVFSRENFLNDIWNTTYHIGDRSVDIYISKLREKLKSISKYIKTVKGVGYKLE